MNMFEIFECKKVPFDKTKTKKKTKFPNFLPLINKKHIKYTTKKKRRKNKITKYL